MSTPNPWKIIGGPSPGTVAALAVGKCEGYAVFAGTRAGFYRTSEVDKGAQAHWQRLPAAPVEIIALGVSPNYAEDATILAGTGRGLFVSRDGGDHWQAAHTPMPDPVVLCFCFSPNYRSDGIILAGTLEDGIYYSDTRGERWTFRGFGLLDAAVYALAISPDFARDETVFAGTESALYYSYNGARAWKLLDFPEDATPILSLALSPHFSRDQTLYIGTEHQGLYRSADLGKTWQKTDLPATCVNAISGAPEQESLLAATNAGLFASCDGGQRWTCLFDVPDVFSVIVNDGIIITSLVDEGAWLTLDQATWQPFFSIPARSLTGMVLSPRFDIDPVAFLYGSQEGIWRTLDGGVSWSCLNENLPGLDIQSLALSPGFLQDRTLVAASTDGILMSKDAGDYWSLLTDRPASQVAFSPGGKFIAASFPGGEIRVTQAWEGSWQSVPVPWQNKAQIRALAIDDNLRLKAAVLDYPIRDPREQAQELLSIWEGEAGHFEQILSRPVSPAPVVRFWIPPHEGSGSTWYASLDQQIWEFRRPWEKGLVSASLVFEAEEGGRVLTLTGSQTPGETVLFACTGQTLYQSIGANAWTTVHDFGDERAISLALSPAYPDDATVFVLLLGGSFCRGSLRS